VADVAASGLPAGHGLPEELALAAVASCGLLAPLPCACGTGASDTQHHGTVRTLSWAQDERAPVDWTASVGECTVCGARWVFETRGDSHYGYDCDARPSRV
jgi:hypothetical protein